MHNHGHKILREPLWSSPGSIYSSVPDGKFYRLGLVTTQTQYVAVVGSRNVESVDQEDDLASLPN